VTRRTSGAVGTRPSAIRGRGRVGALALALGMALTTTAAAPAGVAAQGPGESAACPTRHADGRSVARQWSEAILEAIRRDLPAPTVHARNLFHLSGAMWDAWAAYDAVAAGFLVKEKLRAEAPQRARERAMSYAAYRILSHRYRNSVGAAETLPLFDATMAALCYPAHRTGVRGDTPTALGNRIAAAYLEHGLRDGARERRGYEPPDYEPVNEPLVVARPGAVLTDPNRWQPLALEVFISQNNIPMPGSVQGNLTPHWGRVASFALPRVERDMPMDPGTPPHLGDPASDAEFRAAIVDVIRRSSWLDADDGATIDISPRSLGNNPLGMDSGRGYAVNPFTGEPYAPDIVKRGDYARAVAAYWADGPRSETPPGHWNTIANVLSDQPGFERRIGGEGPELDPLEWDVKAYLVLNGALHDAAIAAWGAKGHYDYVRPISLVRWMGLNGQSSDPDGPSYHEHGLTLVPGLIEVITAESSAPGERHEHLAEFAGEIAIRAWRGNPEDPHTQVSGVGWIRAVEWVPFQLPTFVTPAFAGYVSGHSTFSRAAAEVLTAITGSPYFPGGISHWVVPAGSLEVEHGPTQDIDLQWATYQDAADQAGISRIFGGIHVRADDFGGRRLGYECGREAWALAQRYYDGSIDGRSPATALQGS
jgi:hypothetical protein